MLSKRDIKWSQFFRYCCPNWINTRVVKATLKSNKTEKAWDLLLTTHMWHFLFTVVGRALHPCTKGRRNGWVGISLYRNFINQFFYVLLITRVINPTPPRLFEKSGVFEKNGGGGLILSHNPHCDNIPLMLTLCALPVAQCVLGYAILMHI